MRRTIAVVVLAPPLCGALVLGLLLLAVFQWPGANVLRDSFVPFAVGEVWLMLPRAVLLALLMRSAGRDRQRHLWRLLKHAGDAGQRNSAAAGLWLLDGRFRFACWGMLAWWTFFELTLASLLNPIVIEPAMVVLYNQMHYGHIAGLSAMLLVATGLAVAIGAAAFGLYRFAAGAGRVRPRPERRAA